MSQLTKRAIATAFMQLLGQKKLDKITVQDITSACGINRQTFYYHFEDIYALMRWIFESESTRILGVQEDEEDWARSLLALCEYLKANHAIIMNVYRSLGREELERFLSDSVVERFMKIVETESAGMHVFTEEKRFVARFFSWAFVGIVLEWIGSDMREDMHLLVDNFCVILDGEITMTLQKFENRAKSGESFRQIAPVV